MDCAKFAERDVNAHRLGIFGIVLARLEIGAIWIRRTGAGQRGLDGLSGRGHHAYVQTCDRNLVTRLCDGVLAIEP